MADVDHPNAQDYANRDEREIAYWRERAEESEACRRAIAAGLERYVDLLRALPARPETKP